MEKISKIGVNNIIDLINHNSIVDKYYQPQIEIIDKTKNADFLIFCDKLSDFTFVDELGGKSYTRRYRIDKNLNDVIHKADTGISCGIKVIKNPLIKLSEWEEWEDGYIEGFIRMDSDIKGIEWFVWQYIKMSKLSIILNEFKDDLYIFN